MAGIAEPAPSRKCRGVATGGLASRLRTPTAGTQEATNYALFVECKIVGGGFPVARYLAKGLLRFIDGDYAWAMSSGLMVAYARGGASVAKTLAGRLARRYRTKAGPTPRLEDDGVLPKSFVSVHSRPLRHPSSGQALGDIEVAHLWLPVAGPASVRLVSNGPSHRA